MGLLLAYGPNAKPQFDVGAAITGAAEVGETLTCSYTVTKARPQNVTVQWYSYNYIDEEDPVAAGETLLGASATYTLTSDEMGRIVRAKVTATNNAGTVTSSAYTTHVLDPQPAPVIRQPAAIIGTLTVGSILSVAYDFDYETSVTYAWKAATPGDPPTGETTVGAGSTYALTSSETGKVMRVVVTGVNAYGSTPNASEYTNAVTGGTGTFLSDPSLLLDPVSEGYCAGEYINCECTVSGGAPAFAWYWTTDDADAEGNRNYITANVVATSQPLPVSQPDKYRAAYFADTATFGGANADTRYIGCEVTAGEDTAVIRSAVKVANIVGTALSQSDFGAAPAAPHYINPIKADATHAKYYLTEDVSFAGSAIAIKKNNIHLNLNGHKISFNNDHPDQLTNTDFESGATGWDFANAPHASIHAPADPVAAYRLCQMWYGSTKSVRFDAAQTAEEYIQSTSTVTLKAGVTYCVSAFCAYGAHEEGVEAVVGRIRLVDAADGTTVVATGTAGKQGDKWITRGMAHLWVEYTPPSDKQYYVRISCTGAAGAPYDFYVDQVKVGRSRVSGVMWWPSWANATAAKADVSIAADGSQYGTRIRNGTIEETNPSISPFGIITGYQANGDPIWRYYRNAAIYCTANQRATSMVRLTLITRGVNMSSVYYNDSSNPEWSNNVYDSTITNYNDFSSFRDNYYGANVVGVAGTFARNTITHGCMGGYVLAGGWQNGRSLIYGNRFSLQDKYSNAFCIHVPRGGAAYDNIIECGSGSNSGRGIATGEGGLSAAQPTEVYNNIISVQMLGEIQEYKGGWVLGNYGVQCEAEANYSRLQYVRCYGNVINANGNAYRPSQCIRITLVSAYFHTALDNQFYDNTLNATWNGSGGRSACVYNSSGYECTFTDNTLSTNNGLINLTGAGANITLTGTHIKAVDTVATPTPWMSTWDWAAVTAEFINTTFEDAGSESLYDITTIASEYGVAAPQANFTIVRTS